MNYTKKENYVLSTDDTRVQSPKSILLVLTLMYSSVSYLILTVDEKAVMTGRV